MLAGEQAVVEKFSQLGLPATQVATAKTGVREATILARALRACRVDVLVVDRPRDLRLAALATLYHRAPIVNRYNLSRWNPPPDLLSRLAYVRVAMTIFLSRVTAERALQLAPYIRRKPHRVIPGAVDTELFRPAPAEAVAFRAAYALGGRPVLLAVGSLTLDKRYDLLFEMVASLSDLSPTLVICGDGPLAPDLIQQARARQLDVRFLGLVPPEGLRGAYAAATCFVHACAIETFGLSVLEAMSCGCAVVAVRGGAVPEVLGDAGLLAPDDDAPGLTGLVRRVLGDCALRSTLGEAARRRATEAFSLARMRESYSDVIESVGGK